MLLSISATNTNSTPATDLGFLLHKHPDRCQTFDLSFGKAHVFYPHASHERCDACLLLDVDPVGLVRGRNRAARGMMDQYVNDRPYVASSLMSVAISQVFGSALAGRCKERSELVDTEMHLTARIDVLPIRGPEGLLERIFVPLGYEVTAIRHALDAKFPDWGEGLYFSVQLTKVTKLTELLQHLYVLIPVFDGKKHYYIGEDEVDKLLAKGEPWLSDHPEREFVTRRYLMRRHSLVRDALARLIEADGGQADDEDVSEVKSLGVESVGDAEKPSLHRQRIEAVLGAIRATGASKVLDLGCGEGKLLRELLADPQFTDIVGMDVSVRSLEYAHRRLKLDRLPEKKRQRIRLIHGSLTYRDARLEGFDAAALVEVIEHLDPARLLALERVVFEKARPSTVVLTTPNREYNVMWESLTAGDYRHADHRFEWSRIEFQDWANRIAERFDYEVRYQLVGAEEPEVGAPSQMAIFTRLQEQASRENADSQRSTKSEV